MKKNSLVYLHHILDSITLLEKYMKGVSKKNFLNSEEKQDLAVRRIEVIGEATKNISPELKNKYPHILWKQAAGMRDILIHHYLEVDYIIVWDAITIFIPLFKKQIEKILKQEEK